MTYKIVQTIERGRKSLVIVPSFWEDKGKLWWPPKKTLFKLMKDDQSEPSKDWKLMKCTLKRNNIQTYQLADDELSAMEENSDTDVQDTVVVEPRETVDLPSQGEINFELLANNLTYNQENQENSNINLTATENFTNSENVLQILNAETVNFDLILSNQNIIAQKLDAVLQIQEVALKNQEKITQELARQSVQLDEITVQLAEINEGRTTGTNVTLLKDVNAADNESFAFKPIDSQRELISLDQLLADKTEKKKFRHHLSFLCTPSNGTGITCAYKLLDILFTRDFLCLCSWAGGSRGDRSKIALKDYKNLLKFFHAMILTWDPTYTVQDNEKFFKIVTRNSTQRKCMKNVRTSSKRSRKLKDNLDKRQKTGNEKPPNDDTKDTERESIQIEERAAIDVDDETEEESQVIQEQALEKENITNNIIDDEDEYDLC
ncbi:hypothetical protein B5X24_HaOG202060 [Helicoverpa armigera]|uniref:DUF4806 domain-containing protein n=1 Tax=Helicoverpa armigera TaxID=29058 RepID=A0A2W1B657_HELAM|nr:hypothetical protein B5X24_HaOG202060 [Helicoverpa armigera]